MQLTLIMMSTARTIPYAKQIPAFIDEPTRRVLVLRDAILSVKKNLHCGYEIEKLLHHAHCQIERVFGSSELVYLVI